MKTHKALKKIRKREKKIRGSEEQITETKSKKKRPFVLVLQGMFLIPPEELHFFAAISQQKCPGDAYIRLQYANLQNAPVSGGVGYAINHLLCDATAPMAKGTMLKITRARVCKTPAIINLNKRAVTSKENSIIPYERVPERCCDVPKYKSTTH